MLGARLWPERATMDAAAVPQARPESQSFVVALPRALVEALSRHLAVEQERWFPWCVVAFGAGIVVYFALGTEPSRLVAALVALAAIAFAASGLRSSSTFTKLLCALIAASSLGFTAAKLRTERVDAPI